MLKVDKTKWCYMYDTDDGNDGTLSDVFDSFDEAMSEAIGYLELQTGDTVWIGHPSYFTSSSVDAEEVLCQIAHDAKMETDNWSTDYEYLQNVSGEHLKELEQQLTEVYRQWEHKHGYTCKAYVVKDAKEYTIGKSNEEFWDIMFDSLDRTTDEAWEHFIHRFDAHERLQFKKSLKIGDRITFRRRHLPGEVEIYGGVINSYLDWRTLSYEVKLNNGDITDYSIPCDVLIEVNGNEID